jgi:cytoskeletal protein CcmA (bactofilin family)
MGIFGKPTDNKPGDPLPPAPAQPRPMAPAPQPAAPSHAAASPAAAAVRTVSPTLCVVGANTTVKGEILGDEDVVIEGTVEGQIRIGRELRVGQGGKGRATVSAQSVVVSGEMQGDCEAHTRVEIQSTGRLIGNIRAPKIVIAEGAVFRGNSDMSGRADRKDRAANS